MPRAARGFPPARPLARWVARARVIHCMRDPLDVCVSNYLTQFTAGNSYAFDLTNLGLYYRQYERLMDHWRRYEKHLGPLKSALGKDALGS